jgi:hypothetical protein
MNAIYDLNLKGLSLILKEKTDNEWELWKHLGSFVPYCNAPSNESYKVEKIIKHYDSPGGVQ